MQAFKKNRDSVVLTKTRGKKKTKKMGWKYEGAEGLK